MEIRITAKHLLIVLLVISWIIFIGISIEAGGFIFNTIYTAIKPENAKFLWHQDADLTALYAHDKGHFFAIRSIMIIVAMLKATIFYLVIKIMSDKKLTIAQPFNATVVRFITTIACITFGIAFFSFYGEKYSAKMISDGITMPGIQYLRIDGADVWLFMGVTLLVLAQIFKRGIEIQTENELTV